MEPAVKCKLSNEWSWTPIVIGSYSAIHNQLVKFAVLRLAQVPPLQRFTIAAQGMQKRATKWGGIASRCCRCARVVYLQKVNSNISIYTGYKIFSFHFFLSKVGCRTSTRLWHWRKCFDFLLYWKMCHSSVPNSDIQENEPWRLRAINHLAYVSQDVKSLAFGFHIIKAWRKDAGELLYTIEWKWASLLKSEASLHFIKGKEKTKQNKKNMGIQQTGCGGSPHMNCQ